MAQESQQPDLFDWKPEEKNFLEKTGSTHLWTIIINAVIICSLLLFVLGYETIFSFLVEHILEVGAVIALITSLILLWQVPKRQTAPLNRAKELTRLEFDNLKDQIKLRDELRKTLAQIIGGVFITIGLTVTYNTFELNRQGQIAERIKNSKDINDKIDLYSLELICQDSPKNQSRILEILTSYVRNEKENSREQNLDAASLNQNDASKNANISPRPDSNSSQNTNTAPVISEKNKHENILFAAKIILDGNCGKNLKSRSFSMENGDFSNFEYEKAQFTYAILINANFSKAVLKGANFIGAILKKADFTDADLTGADLSGADLTDAETKGANFTNADLSFSGITRNQLLAAENCKGVKLSPAFENIRDDFPCRKGEEKPSPTQPLGFR
jgi:uncharacterized protein YjbI with pentapeptide repeats